MKTIVFTLISISLFGMPLVAQQVSSGADRKQAADADVLRWIVGKWEGSRLEPANGNRVPMKTDITSILDGAGEEEQLVVDTPKPYHGMYVQVFDPKLQKSVLMYVNATRREFVRLEGTAGPNRAEWFSTTIRGSHRSKLVYDRLSENSWRRTQFVSEDEGQTWTVLFIDELKRRKS